MKKLQNVFEKIRDRGKKVFAEKIASTIVKIFAKSEEDENSKPVALVFSLVQTDKFLVNFC